MREEHKQDTIGYQGSKVPWWLVLYYAAFMVAAFNYMGTFFARDLFDWNADAKRMQHDLWQGAQRRRPAVAKPRRRRRVRRPKGRLVLLDLQVGL